MPHDPRQHPRVLLPESAGVVVDPVARADLAQARRDFHVARRRQVREQVVLDLVAQVPGHDMEPAPALEVARALDLAQVPLAAGLAGDLAPGVGLDLFGEVPAEDDRVGPHVADEVGGEVAQQHARPLPEGQRREQHVVLEQLAPGLAQEGPHALAELRHLHPALEEAPELEVLHRHAPLEVERQDEVGEWLQQARRRPLLLLGQAQHAVAEVVVLADDVGVVVVVDVVRLAPVVGRAGDVPVVGAGIEAGVVHPVVLAVQHVVADLHVLEDLGRRQADHASDPAQRPDAEHQQAAPADRGALDDAAHAADVARVARADVGVLLAAQGLDLGLERGQGFAFEADLAAHVGVLWLKARARARSAGWKRTTGSIPRRARKPGR